MNSRQKILAVVAVATIIVAGFLIGKRYVNPGVKDTLGLKTVGEVAADETSRLLDGKGRIAVIKVESGLGQPTELIWRGFAAALKKQTGIQVVAEEIVPGSPANTSAHVREVILKHSALAAVVLLGGSGDVQFTTLKDLPAPQPRLVSVLTFDLGQAVHLFEGGILVLGIAERPIGKRDPALLSSFETQYAVVTAETVKSVKEELGKKPTEDFVP
ncbi:MAG: hypothetical protein PCFJNLEI_00241 [Verrucomicrobiae bacterium]|nr:hypothetical protein [Verrucomicrobiae bacterium]